MGRLFGTDGVRGRANVDLTAELALDLAVAAAHVLGEQPDVVGHQPVAVVGRDPRASGEFLEAAVVAGLASAGCNVIRVGIVPTPGLAYLVGALRADLGVMLSASHNPMSDNGIKFFARGGLKLDDAVEDAIEARLDEQWQRPIGAAVGRVTDNPGAVESYVAHLVSTLDDPGEAGRPLAGLSVVVDAANGAASHTAVATFERLGAAVIALHTQPDGININEACGSTHPEDLQAAVVEHGADLGIALDGDADRCLAVDATGELVDGDQILAILATAFAEQDRLPERTLVVTVMSNLGLLNAMRTAGIAVQQTKVGDRYVLESMNGNGWGLGGEQSGHVVIAEHATTGDGVLTGVQLMGRMASSGRTLGELAQIMDRMPQELINVADVDKSRVDTEPVLRAEIARIEADLGERGRVLLRPSGTEQLVRVMVEADTGERARAIAEHLADCVRRTLGS